MLIDSSGNVGIGTSSVESGFRLHVVGNAFVANTSGQTTGKVVVDSADNRLVLGSYFEAGVGQYSFISSTNNAETGNLPLLFRTGTTERMRIDANGNVLVGKTSTALNVTGIQLTTSDSYGRIILQKTLSGNVNGLLNYHNGTYVGGINYDNTNTSFPTSSDVRLKKDIVEAGSASEKIDAIRIVAHGWKHDDAVVDFGIIAQELYEVMPRAVAKGDDGEEVETTWGVDYSKLVPMLIKAHQEQQAIITDLKARIEVLEAK
jgi:hypothetical protein